MAAKRTPRKSRKSTPARSAPVKFTPDPDAIQPVPPVDVPVLPVPPAVPKAGPPVGGGRSAGVGRGQRVAQARRYAFRRS